MTMQVSNLKNNSSNERNNLNGRSIILDCLKGIAIIAVALYHFGGSLLPYGYLGVDVFFVVGGYLLIKQLHKQFEDGKFNYWSYIFRKIIRLWPLIILASIVSLALGFFLMLPNDYENLTESVVASSLFANNVLQCITTKNYWDIVNLYKPLMHFWYVGVLMQAYILLPLIYVLFSRKRNQTTKNFRLITFSITIISLLLYLLPICSNEWKFYFLPFRLFEITLGGLTALYSNKIKIVTNRIIQVVSFFVIIIMLAWRIIAIPSNIILLVTVLATTFFVFSTKELKLKGFVELVGRGFAAIGKRSYSIYVWHQVIIAFLFYSVFPKQSVISFFAFLIVSVIISLLSYRFIEQPMIGVVKSKRKESAVIIISAFLAFIVSVVSLFVYSRAGVVRDVPELDISIEDAHRGMHSEYCDRVYSWDHPFNNDSRTKILVIGNSFGRDWANILYEYNSDFDISFFYYNEKEIDKVIDRINEAEYVFYAQGLSYGEVPSTISTLVGKEKLYIVSNKNYGDSAGIIYARRYKSDYYSQTVEYRIELQEDILNNELIWGTHFINMMTPVLTIDNRVCVFTDDNKLISQDCRHLTRAGAQYYARILNLDALFKK